MNLNIQASTFYKLNRDISVNSIIKLSKYKQLSILFVQKKRNTPTAPILSVKKTTDTTIDLYWTEASDEEEISGYKVYKDGILEATLGNVLLYKVTGVTVGILHNYKVTAFNINGTESTPSNTLSIKTGSH
ncbi:hypothetical protein BFR04_00020 [Gaetbulibacter sp. 4G1]|nr:hypothetical protein BFR04_00020 [Gaetbulibacter sp. 4G1]